MTEGNLFLDPKATTLVLADFQHDIVSPGGILAPEDGAALVRIDAAIAAAARALAVARGADIPVFHVVHEVVDAEKSRVNTNARIASFVLNAGALRRGNPGFDIVPALAPAEGETVVFKQGISALTGTELDATLRAKGINTIVIGGIVSHWVVEGTARNAFDLGYRAVVLEDACTSGVETSHTGAIERLQFISDIADVAALEGALT